MVLALSLSLASTASAQDETASATGPAPTDFIRTKVDEVLGIVNQQVDRGTDAFRQRADDLKGAVRDFLDYRELCMRALGDHWDDRTPEEQNAFVELMTQLIETNYTVKVGARSSQTAYEIAYEDELVRGDNARVTGTGSFEDEVIAVEVMLVRRDTSWAVWDVVTDDVSIQETYAESFDEIIVDEGWDELIRRIEERLAELQAELDAQMTGSSGQTDSRETTQGDDSEPTNDSPE